MADGDSQKNQGDKKEDKMKMPPGDNNSTTPDQGVFGNYEEAPYFFEQVEVSDSGVPISPAEEPATTAVDADFSEYMWMEHMEEFDREVMKKLEEEALMEECINFNAMLEHEKTESTSGTEESPREQPRTEQPTRQQTETGESSKTAQDVQVEEQPSTSSGSTSTPANFTLNPLAAEFVPANKAGKNLEPKKDT